MDSNIEQDVCYRQPKSLADRVAIVKDFVGRFSYPIPIVIDSMTDAADRIYGGWPERLYIIDTAGTIVYKGGIGPFDFHPEQVREWLAQHGFDRWIPFGVGLRTAVGGPWSEPGSARTR